MPLPAVAADERVRDQVSGPPMAQHGCVLVQAAAAMVMHAVADSSNSTWMRAFFFGAGRRRRQMLERAEQTVCKRLQKQRDALRFREGCLTVLKGLAKKAHTHTQGDYKQPPDNHACETSKKNAEPHARPRR
jgi:hypothetical protein